MLVNGKEYMVDIQEMMVWTALNWWLLDISQVEAEYDRLTRGCTVPERRTMKDLPGPSLHAGACGLRNRRYGL